jgi:hypothetical protein
VEIETLGRLEPISELLEMLTFKRPANSKTHDDFVDRFILPIGARFDTYGNSWVEVKKPDGADSPVLWSCHTDTVHRDEGRQKLSRGSWPLVTLKPGETANCLGADDTAGCWLMLQMIRAVVPGLFIFHMDEEIGGLGSGWIADHRLLKDIKFAIALDRRGTESIITHQGGERTCSDVFAYSLARGLNLTRAGLGKWQLDSGGIFTDTANYTDLVGECTNISVGYYNEHTAAESLDVDHLLDFLNSLTRLDQSALVASREPGDTDPANHAWGRSWYWGDYLNHANDPLATPFD